MGDVTTGEGSAGLVGHGVYDTQQGVGESHTGQTLGIVHLLPGVLVAAVGSWQVFHHHGDSLQGQRIGKGRMKRRNVGLNCVSKGIHARVSCKSLRHRLGQIGIQNGDIRKMCIRDRP